MEQQPEMFSVALAGGNKCTIGLRTMPITPADYDKILEFLSILKDNLVSEVAERIPQEDIPAPTANANRVLRGYIPTETDLANASSRVMARENFIWTRQAMEDARMSKLSTKSSNESEDDSQSS